MKYLDAIKYIGGILGAVVIIVGVIGYISEPHAREFIIHTVNDKVEVLEEKIKKVETLIYENRRVGKDVQSEQRILKEQQKLIIDLLKKQQRDNN